MTTTTASRLLPLLLTCVTPLAGCDGALIDGGDDFRTAVDEASADQVVVTHTYESMTNGRATLDGSAVVTWTQASRHVVTDLDVETARGSFTANADRTGRRIGEAGDGIVVDGVRNWSGPRGDWQVDIEDVEMRGIDLLPQDGAYVLTQPNGNELTMTFDRIDADTIEVAISGGRRDRRFHVTSAGAVDDA